MRIQMMTDEEIEDQDKGIIFKKQFLSSLNYFQGLVHRISIGSKDGLRLKKKKPLIRNKPRCHRH